MKHEHTIYIRKINLQNNKTTYCMLTPATLISNTNELTKCSNLFYLHLISLSPLSLLQYCLFLKSLFDEYLPQWSHISLMQVLYEVKWRLYYCKVVLGIASLCVVPTTHKSRSLVLCSNLYCISLTERAPSDIESLFDCNKIQY